MFKRMPKWALLSTTLVVPALALAGCSAAPTSESPEPLMITGETLHRAMGSPSATPRPTASSGTTARQPASGAARTAPNTSGGTTSSGTTSEDAVPCLDQFMALMVESGELTEDDLAGLARVELDGIVKELIEEEGLSVAFFCAAIESGEITAADFGSGTTEDKAPCVDAFIKLGMDSGFITQKEVDSVPRSLFDELAVSMAEDGGWTIEQFCGYVDSGALTLTSMDITITIDE